MCCVDHESQRSRVVAGLVLLIQVLDILWRQLKKRYQVPGKVEGQLLQKRLALPGHVKVPAGRMGKLARS